MPKHKKYLGREKFEQDGKFSSKEHIRRHKEIIKERKKDIKDRKKNKKKEPVELPVENIHAKRHHLTMEFNRLVREGDETTKIKREQLHAAIKEIENEIETNERNARTGSSDIEAS